MTIVTTSFIIFSISVSSLPLFAQDCSWAFSRRAMILDFNRELMTNPHSAFYIGSQIRLSHLQRTIEEISGERALDKSGCLIGRCKAIEKARFREYLVRKIRSLGATSYFEWARNENMSGMKLNGNPDLGPLSFRKSTAAFAKKLVQAKTLNSFFAFLRYAKFELTEENFKSIDVDLVEGLIEGLSSNEAQGSLGSKFDTTWGKLRRSPFVKHEILSKRFLGELSSLKERLYAGKIAANLARGNDSALLNTPEVINVIAEIKGSKFPDEIIEVSAHYDTVPRAPGADDNGSGISTMIEMIRVFKKFSPERTIRFVFTDLEEFGKYGSILHAQSLISNKDKLLAALVIDTIGFHPKRENKSVPVYVLELGTRQMHTTNDSYQQARSLAQAIAWQSNRYHRGVRYSIETNGALPSTGDHGSYLEAGLPAVFAAAGFEGDLVNPGYHKPTDTIQNYNWAYFVDIARVLTESIAVISGARVSDQEYQSISKENLAKIQAAVDPEGAQRKLLRTIPGKGIPKPKPVEDDEDAEQKTLLEQMRKYFGL